MHTSPRMMLLPTGKLTSRAKEPRGRVMTSSAPKLSLRVADQLCIASEPARARLLCAILSLVLAFTSGKPLYAIVQPYYFLERSILQSNVQPSLLPTANRGKGWPKQKPQAAATHHNSIFSMHDKTGTTPTCRKYIKTSREKHSQPLPVKTCFDYFQ